jgi:NADPH-dependent 2,4-dienoyl-CoA reductase/sulfur reductase-like enzyme
MTARRHDVVVVGAGPAGLAAAATAAAMGRSVLLLDQAPRPGGQIWRHRAGASIPARARQLMARVRASGVEQAVATVVDAPAPGTLAVDFGGYTGLVHAGAIVLATGAVERLLPFPGWTLPGVTGVGGIQALLKGGLQVRGRRVVVAGSGPLLYPVAASLAHAGARVVAVLEQAPFGAVARFGARALLDPSRFLEAVRYRAATWRSAWHHDAWVIRARGTERLESVTVSVRGRTREIACDWLGAAAGLAPRTELARLLGCALEGEAIAVDATQATSVPNVWAAGECTGVKGDAAAVLEGQVAGAAAAGDGGGMARRLAPARARGIAFGQRLASTFAVRPGLRDRITPDTILCRCEDVPAGAIDPEWNARQAKLWTRVGMGLCQGNVCGVACSALYGWEPPVVRPPLAAPTLAAWAAQFTPRSDPPPG